MASSSDEEDDAIELRKKKLVNSQLFSDVSFAVGKKGTVVYGHRYPLAVASDVFHQMFTGKLTPANGDHIEVPDIAPDVFLEMLKFIYHDNAAITEDNLVQIYYAAEKYNLSGLIGECLELVSEEETWVLQIFTDNLEFGFEELNQACMGTVRSNPLKVFNSTGFLELPLELVERIAKDSKLRCNDDQLMEALEKWADYQDKETQSADRHDAIKRLKTMLEKQWELKRDYLCKKLMFFGKMSDSKHHKPTVLNVRAKRDLDLYGIGMYIGKMDTKEKTAVIPVTISVSITQNDRTVELSNVEVQSSNELYVYDCMFERYTLEEDESVTLVCGLSNDETNREYNPGFPNTTFEVRYLSFVGDSSAMSINFPNWHGSTSIAYILYNDRSE